MIKNVCSNCNIDYVLGRIRDILNKNFNNSYDNQIYDYLIAAHNLFLTWSSKFEPKIIDNSTQVQLKITLSDFILEANNGSWNNMQRTGSAVANSAMLKNLLKILINYKINNSMPDMNDVITRLNSICNPAASGHVGGMSVFLATAILFARDDKNFMVIDKPVRECFGLKNDITQLTDYDNIIQYSQGLAQKYGVDLWYVNKAYGICQSNMHIKIWHLGHKFPALGNSHEVKL